MPGNKGIFRVGGVRSGGRLTYNLSIEPIGSGTELYSQLSGKDVLRYARTHRGYRPYFEGVLVEA